MKLRFTPNSVRLRLNRIEVEKLESSGGLSERIEFPGTPLTSFVYSLRLGSNSEDGSVRFRNQEFEVTVFQDRARAWAHTASEVGLYYNHELSGKSLRIAIEKDFQCIDGPLEELDPAAYPHPETKNGCKAEQQ